MTECRAALCKKKTNRLFCFISCNKLGNVLGIQWECFALSTPIKSIFSFHLQFTYLDRYFHKVTAWTEYMNAKCDAILCLASQNRIQLISITSHTPAIAQLTIPYKLGCNYCLMNIVNEAFSMVQPNFHVPRECHFAN